MLHVSYYLLYDYGVCLTTLSVQLHTVSNLPRLSGDSWLMARRWLVLIRSWRVTVLFCDSQSWCAPARGLVVGASASALVGREFEQQYVSVGSLPGPCKLVLQHSYQAHGVRKELKRTHTGHKNKPSTNETRNCTNSVVVLQDHGSYKAPTTNHHIKQIVKWSSTVKWIFDFYLFVIIYRFVTCFVQMCWSSTH